MIYRLKEHLVFLNIKRGFDLGLVLVRIEVIRMRLYISYVSLNHTKNQGIQF
jgi:hypothetical protein